MDTTLNDYPIQGYYLFNSGKSDSITAFEKMTRLRVNRQDVVVFPIAELEDVSQDSKEESWWNSFWEDGWSHLTFGTVSTAFGIGILCLATGPAGWITGALAIGGGTISAFSGTGQLLSTNSETKQLYASIGDAALSLNNIPGLVVGTGSYVFTKDFDQSMNYANYAGIASGSTSLIRSGWNALRMQKLYSFNVGLNNTGWSSITRNINARLVGINPKGLEGSHLIPQRVVQKMVAKAPRLKKTIENFFNGPLCISFMKDTEHALVDSYRWRTLPLAQKETLRLTNPYTTFLIENYPQFADALGFFPNMSSTVRPVASSLVITSGRAVKSQATSSSNR